MIPPILSQSGKVNEFVDSAQERAQAYGGREEDEQSMSIDEVGAKLLELE